MIKPIRLSAIVPSTNLSKTKSFLVDALNFKAYELKVAASEYGIVKTAGTELHIQYTEDIPNEMSIYLLVESVDNVWEQIKDIDGLKTKAPFIQDYGLKEVHVILPCTNTLMFIGEDLG